MNLFPFIPLYTHHIYDGGRQTAFVVLVSFLVTFLCARGYTRLARLHGWKSASFGGVHTHHLVFGVVMVLLAGAMQFAFLPQDDGPWQLVLAAMFGSGAALVLDEFALLFHLQDVYWEHEGRKSIDAIVIATLLGVLFLLHTTPFGSTSDMTGAALTVTGAVNLIFVLVAAIKGKLFLAVFGVFVPLLAFVGALRLAEPGSIWAHRWYAPGSKNMRRAQARYQKYEAFWRPRKERLWDFLGGKPGRPLRQKQK
ncbi:hypothetical protein EYC59_04950 [Candidatus Saccharibacteria bacterium]|nr:MAG: hypothetical protein EYC59_04950 [Candidatus Saccharibacteria bacterium]